VYVFNDPFTKTGSGQTEGNAEKRGVFCCRAKIAEEHRQMIELSSETQQATTDQWREKTHALTSEMTEMQRGHSEALKAASRAANYDEEALRMVRCRLFRVLSLCLSRACLGKMIIFIYKWL
jgi:hypothetical protein